MNKIKCVLVFIVFCGALFAAAKPAKAKLIPCRVSTGDEFIITHCHPYLGGSRSPGDSVGMTGLEYQANGGCLKRIFVDDSFQVHVSWMKVPFPFTSTSQRRMEWNFRYNDGSYFGEVDATPFTSGYGSLDLTQDPNVAMQRTVISYHYNNGSYYVVDQGNGYGSFAVPHNPTGSGILWPVVAAAKNGNFILATDDNNGNFHHCFTTTDNGTTWTNPFNSDSCATISQFIMASRFSNKVGYVETRYITDSIASGQLDNNVWYRLSMDGGLTWGAPVNITNYQPGDTFRAYCNVSCVFDQNDNFHVVWSARLVRNGEYYDASKILHWDEIHNQITIVSPPTGIFDGGWWGWTHPNGFGAWRMPADDPLMSVYYPTGTIYCFWSGQSDTTDYSLSGWPNGDIYTTHSHDGGLTWDMLVNLTNTHTPGAPAGACEDEDYFSVCPYLSRDSVFLVYIEDKDAGAITQTEGDTTDNPVRLMTWRWMPDVEEMEKTNSGYQGIRTEPSPSVKHVMIEYFLQKSSITSMKLFDISGQLIKIIDQGRKEAGDHRIIVNLSDIPAGTYFIVLKEGENTRTAKLVKAR